MNDTLTRLYNAAEQEITNGSIYVWAASGELGTSVSEKWIRTKEARNQSGANAADAVAMWKKRIDAGNTAFRVFDCSGFVSFLLVGLGVASGRRDCDGIWARCEKLGKPVDGALLFRVSSSNAEDETHVGLYLGGYQYHAKGRKYGVVKEPYKASYWHKIGWYTALPKDAPETQEQQTSGAYKFTRLLKYGVSGADVVELKKLLITAGYSKGITVGTSSSANFRGSTRDLVKAFQRDRGLEVDGIAGKNTITALGGIWNK
jgi:hypothetical protein